MYFSIDPDGYVEFHQTVEEAKKRAEGDLEHCQDCAATDGWHEDVTNICWGEVKQRVVLESSTPTPGGRFDSIDEYVLVDVPPSLPRKR
jgi:hypothetical protein